MPCFAAIEMNHGHQPPRRSLPSPRIERVCIVVSPDDTVTTSENDDAPARSDGDVADYVRVHARADLIVCGTGQVVASPGTWRIKRDQRELVAAEARHAYEELTEILLALGLVLDDSYESTPWDEAVLRADDALEQWLPR